MTLETFRHALILTGPTGSGKTDLALELAERLNAEIVAMDSMTLYRGMDIGTAKPTSADQRRVRHHLIDALDPSESASVAWWLEQAAACCHDIESRNKRALFVGGTPLYLKALIYGLFEGPGEDAPLRRRLLLEAETHSPRVLFERLARVDPIAATKIHPNDVRRVVRALEVWELTGTPISAWQQQWRQRRAPTELRPNQVLWLDIPRQELYQRINLRVVKMIEGGLLEEARDLRKLPRPLSKQALQALGYRETFAYLDGLLKRDEMIHAIQRRGRQFAKRQLTWFRRLPECQLVAKDLVFAAWGLDRDWRKNDTSDSNSS